jgi:Nif11 domain
MTGPNVIAFLRLLGEQPALLDALKVASKDDAIAAAAEHGLPFTEADFDPLIWGLEVDLARHRGEAFDGRFPLWHLMWGQYYLEYLVLDLLPALDAAGLT